jgi:membrane protease YdiL (CAAX protease family)
MIDGLVTGAVNLALFAALVWIRRLLHDEGPAAFGLHGDARGWRSLLAGVAAGTLLFTGYTVALVCFGLGTLFAVRTQLPATLGLAGAWGFGFAGVALFEEGLFRGYLLEKMRAKLPLAVAVTGQAVLFGMLHLLPYNATAHWWLGALNTTIFGIGAAVLVLRTGSLMFVVGLHLAWDLVATLLLGDQVRGVRTALNVNIAEKIWTGTAATPEVGLIVTVIFGMLVVFAAVSKRAPRSVRPTKKTLQAAVRN